MAAKRAPREKKNDYPKSIIYGSGKVRINRRGNGLFLLTWREMGDTKKTTKATEATALEWATIKARELDAKSGKQWIHAGEAEALKALQSLCPGGAQDGGLRRMVEDVRGALKWLEGGTADLTQAARWFAEHGPLKVERTTLEEAVTRWLAEYATGSNETRRTFAQEIEGGMKWMSTGKAAAKRSHDGPMMLMDITEPILSEWCGRKVHGGKETASPRTVDNRITTWITFLNRCRDWRLLPEGKHAGDLVRRPTVPDAGKEIFTVDQGRALLAAVRKHDPKLEAYLIIGGWIGLRPTEIQKLTWSAMEWDRGYCHVFAEKTQSERYVPVDARVMARLHEIFLESKKKPSANVCRHRSREFLSVLARAHGVCDPWPNDVLRHSFCSYRIAVTKSLDQVADEAGNSPSILKSNYRRPLREEDGIAWWNLIGP